MRQKIILVTSWMILIATTSCAQLYPDTTANWCLDRTAWPPLGGIFSMVMYADADTLIDGQLYKRIYDNSHLTGSEIGFEAPIYYVRNAPNGKAYAYILEDSTEYLTADLNAQIGDTIENVLVWNEQWTCPDINFEYGLVSVVVDSIVQTWLQGSSYARHYLSSDCYDNSSFYPELFFWQPGMGTSHGPVLAITNGLDLVILLCAEAADTMNYSFDGFPCNCIPYNNISESNNGFGIDILAGALPGTYNIDHNQALEIEVFNATGALVLQTNGLHFDISQQPPGIYIVRLRGKAFVWSQKVVR